MRRLMMIAAFAAAALSPAALAGPAAADPVAIAPIGITPDLSEQFRDDFGDREFEYLQGMVTRSISAALERRGAQIDAQAPLVIEVTLVDADPNKPTFKQITDTPGLDYFSSISVGGAEFSAVLRRADGEVLTELSYRRFSRSLDEINEAGGAWSEARRAARTFASRVADAYVGHQSTAMAQ